MTQQHLDVFNHGYDDAERGHPFDGGPYAGDEARAYRRGFSAKVVQAYNASALRNDDPREDFRARAPALLAHDCDYEIVGFSGVQGCRL